MFQTIKLAMMLSKREVYPQTNFTKKNEELEKYRFEVPQQLEKYEKDKNMMVALNSTSFSGQVSFKTYSSWFIVSCLLKAQICYV